MRGADAIALALRSEGVGFVAGITSGSTMEISDGLLTTTPEIRTILTRHERVAADLADGYARASGQPGVCLAVLGPGASHLFAGLAQAYADGVPVLGIVGQVPRARAGTRSTSEMPLLNVFQYVSKWEASINMPTRVAEIMRRAFVQLRNGPPGPVLLEVPSDVALESFPDEQFHYTPAGEPHRYGPDYREVERAADLLVHSQRPLIYAGSGVLKARASEELQQLAELLSAPVMTTLGGKSAFPENHPLALGLGGFPRSNLGTAVAYKFAKNTDCLLAIGNSFAFQASSGRPFPAGVKLIHSHVDCGEIDRIYATDAGLVGDARLVLLDLLEAVRDRLGSKQAPSLRPEVVEDVRTEKARWLREWMPLLTSDEVPLNPFRVTWEFMHAVDRQNTIFTHDAGAVRGHACHHYEAIVPGSFVGWGQQSSMGWTIGGSMGIKLAHPEKLVAYAIGDGSFGMTGMDLETAVRNEIPTLGLIYNNSLMGIVSEIQHREFGGRSNMVELGGDYVGVAKALGAYAERVERPEEIRPAIERATRATRDGKPAIIEFVTKPLEPQPRPDKAPGSI